MFLFIYLCLCWTMFVVPVVSEESGVNTKCTENGDCINNKLQLFTSNDESNTVQISNYEMIDDYGEDRINISDIKTLLSTLIEKSDNYDKIQKDVAFVFQGVIVAVILFGVCASICVISACIYCCRINIIDNRLKSDVEALAEKLQRDIRLKKSTKKTPLAPISESCNIINADAGVFCV